MTSSRLSKRWLVLVLLVFGLGGLAYADKRKRVVVLPFEGEKAEKFHQAVVKLLKKSHTVVSTAKWEATAEELSAGKVTSKNIKKVAKKLKIDGVVEGTIEKRRGQYIIRIKLHAGTTGEIVGSPINTKAEGPRLDGAASRDLKDELIDAISQLGANRAGSGGEDDEEEETKPAKTKKPAKEEDDEEETKPAKTKQPAKEEDDEEETKPKKGFSRKPAKADDEEAAALKPKKEEDENPLPKPKKRPGKSSEDDGERVAAKGDGEDIEAKDTDEQDTGPKMDRATALAPGNRAIDAVVGMSFNARRLSWTTAGDLVPTGVAGTGKPPNYKGVPAPGLLVDLTAYPLAFSHKKQGMLKNLGINVMYDKALLISSKDAAGTTLKTAAQRYGVGGVFRLPFNKSAKAPVVAAGLGFGNQTFQIGGTSDIPNVNYTFINASLSFRYPLSDKLLLNTDFSYLLVTNTGQMQRTDQYGAAKVSGLEAEISGDYAISKALFARAAIKLETIGYAFTGNGMLTTGRDGDPEVDVSGARDTYLGGSVTLGYLY
ncbi:MAG: hypothetical protein H6Q90_1477 [Deltaproteobacteria bacterium]|nr:hypothetical protein [Deltaproteobacteria bacterium]